MKAKKKVIQLTLDGKFVKLWNSIYDVEKQLGFASSNITDCCKGKRKSIYKYKWEYYNEE